LAVKLYGDDLNILADKAEEIGKLISGIDGVAGVQAEATRGLPQITINYDRNKLARYGLNINALNQVVETAFSGGIAGVIYEGERLFDLVIRLDESNRRSIEDIRNIYINLNNGAQIPLKEVADIKYQPGPMQISRDNTNRRTYVGINVEGRDIKSLVEEIQLTLDNNLELPSGYYMRYGGAFENLERATDRLSLLVPLALGMIFVLVFFAIKSFKQTLMIYVAVPFAAVGGILALFIRDMPFSISAGVGFIVLFGVAVLNGLVLLSGFNELKEEGNLGLMDIIIKGSIRRIRPILLTASTDILGFLPMAISTSAGAEVQRPLATVVIGGMLTSTLLTLVVIPVLYKWVESKKKINLTPKLKAASFIIIFLIGGIGISSELHAQKTELTLQQAIEIAKKNYPSIKAAKLEIDKQKALKATAYDLGNTSLYTSQEEFGSGTKGVQTQIGIEQADIDIFGIFPKNNFSDAKTELAILGQNLTEYSLIRDVSKAWYRVVNAKQQFYLFKEIDTLYNDFLKAAKLRFNTQQTSKLEYLSASAKHGELQINIKRAESSYKSSLDILNQYLNFKTPFDVATNGLVEEIKILFEKDDSLNNSPILDFFAANVDVAESNWDVQLAGYLPKFDFGYALQSVDGNSGFQSWKIGINLPLVYFSKAGTAEAAKLDYKIAEQEYERERLAVISIFKEKLNRYHALKEVLQYYQEEALPLADEQMQASLLSYRLGNIDYIKFIQNTETAISIKKQYLEQQFDFFKVATELQFLTANNK
jgi:cobalt-zinc-cadmium resistance protein CzcA